MSEVKHAAGEFQLDKKELLKDVPLVLKGIAGAAIDYINNADTNHDGKSDLAQLAPFVIKALPIIAALAPYLDVDGVVKWFVDHDFVKDKAAVTKLLTQALHLATEAAKQVK